MNNISFMGRMTADPKCEYTANGHAVLHFNVAVTRPRTKDTTDFIRCVAWRNSAEFIEKWFSKGKMIAITGILTSKSWKDDNNKNHTIMEVLVDTVDFCGDKSNGANQAEQPQVQPQSQEQAVQTSFDDMPDSFQAAEDDIPF